MSDYTEVDDGESLDFHEWEGADDKFAVQVTGDAMIDAHISDGDYVIIKRQKHARDGQIVAVVGEDSELNLWSYHQEANRVRLEPANKAMQPVYRDSVEILGVLVGLVRKY